VPLVSSKLNRISGVMISVFVSSAVNRGFDPRSAQTKDYKFGICCFSAKHATLKSKNKDWLARNQNNASEWSDMSTNSGIFQLYHGENKLIFNEMMMRSVLF
jgi:tRNA U38,U39,U40 pseudouridine synthase TruA